MKAPLPKAYQRTQILTASPAELRLLLFDGAIRFAEQARMGLANKDYEACFTGATRCQEILLELMNGLRPEHDPELCKKLSALYTFMYMQMVRATTLRDIALIDEVLKLLNFERETWSMLLDQLAAENKSAASGAANDLIGGSVSVQG